jgi:hypothetical protein
VPLMLPQWNPDVATPDAMTVPILIAWAAPSLVAIDEEGTFVYAHLFELVVGASGFTSQQRLHGMVGCECEVLSPTDGSHELIDFRILPCEEPSLYSMGDTETDDLIEWQQQILDSYMQQSGSVYEPVDG